MGMAAAAVKLILAGALVVRSAHASRTRIRKLLKVNESMDSGGNDLCTVSWTAKGVTAQVSFGVRSCLIGCRVTNFDKHYDKMFSGNLGIRQQESFCSCRKPGGRELLKMIGACGTDEEEMKKKCFEQYKVLRTNTYTNLDGKKSTTIVRHPEDYHERTFIYHDCKAGACPDGCPTKVQLPSVSEGMGMDEKEVIGLILKKKRAGEALTRDENELIEQFSEEDLDDMIFADMTSDGNPLTVKKLRDAYKDAFAAHGIDASHVLTSADLYEDQQKVDMPALKRFSKMYDKAQKNKLTDDVADETLFAELSRDGRPLPQKAIREEYEDRLKDTSIQVSHALAEADLYSDNQAVDLKDYKRFRKVLKGVAGGAGTDGALFDAISKGKPMKVKELRKIYEEKLKGTGLKVDKLLAVADLTDDEQEVDLASFRRFLAPDCHHPKKALKKKKKGAKH